MLEGRPEVSVEFLQPLLVMKRCLAEKAFRVPLLISIMIFSSNGKSIFLKLSISFCAPARDTI